MCNFTKYKISSQQNYPGQIVGQSLFIMFKLLFEHDGKNIYEDVGVEEADGQ